MFDKDRSGLIEIEELGQIWIDLGLNVSQAELQAMINIADTDSKYYIQFIFLKVTR